MENMFRTCCVMLACAATAWAELPEPASGGRGGGPLDMLLIKGHSEWAFGRQPELDARYQEMLKARGYRVTVVHEWQSVSAEFLQRFNTVVYLNPSTYMGGNYYDDTAWRSGRHLLTIRKNVDTLREHVRNGGGLFIIPAFEEMGMRAAASLNHMFAPYGLETTCAVTRDNTNHFSAAKIGQCRALYCWTERIGEHAVSEGVKRIYYPSYCTRWDDNYTTIPLKTSDPAWTVVARAMPGSTAEMRRSSIYDPNGGWTAVPGWQESAVMVARPYGKGRVAVTGISAWHLFYITYAEKGDVTESSFSRVAGIPMTEGDGTTKSDLHILLDNTYRWLAAPGIAVGMGGYSPEAGVQAGALPDENDHLYLSDRWAEDDPLVLGPVRPMRVLVGARSAMSSGSGSVQDWAAAAKAAGYDVVCFTETFEDLKHDQWEQYVKDCRAHSDGDVALLPGFDIATDLGNRFLLVGHWAAMRRHILTPDLKQLFWTGHMMLAMGDILPIAARPQWLASVRGEHGALPPDLYSHISGIAVATYRDGKQVDDGRFAYEWHAFNATVPYPIAVHEVDVPGKLAETVKTGLQNYVNSDTPAHAAHYFRQGFTNYGGNPQRYYVSSGPQVDAYGIDNWQSPHWQMHVRAHGDSPITEVLVRDQRRLYRRMTPGTGEIDLTWNGHLGVQHWFLAELRDAKGGTCLLSPVRTLPPFHYARCMDRQNFFGMRFEWLTYVGRMAMNLATVEVPGVTLMAPVCPKPQMNYAGNRITVLDFVLDSTHVPSGTHWDPVKQAYAPGGRRYGADNAPLFNDLPIPEYWGRVRYITYRHRADKRMVGSIPHAEMIVDIKMREDVASQGDVWPVIGKTAANGAYRYTDAAGKRVEGKLEEGFVDLPEGGTVNNVVALSPLRVNSDGLLGFAPPDDGAAEAGTVYRGAFTIVEPSDLDAIHKSMGLDGPTPYEFTIEQGRVDRIAGTVHFAAENGGVAGRLKGAELPLWAPKGMKGLYHARPHPGLPIRLHDANPRWVAGLWLSDGTMEPFGFLEDVLLGTMVTEQDCGFYFGNLVTATDPELNLAFASDWTRDGARVEVNNPTDKAITATVRTATAVTGRKAIEAEVTVPAGTTVYIDG